MLATLKATIPHNQFVVMSAASAGIVATAITHPLDTWAVYRQTGYRSRVCTLPMLYRGIGPALLQSTIVYGAMIGSYELFRSHYNMSLVAAASLSAFPESIIRGPLEAIKNLRQTNQPVPNLLSRNGARFCGIGFAYCLAREVPGNIAYFYCYEEARNRGWGPFISGTAAATGFTACCYPLEALRAQAVTGMKKQITFRGSGFYWMRCVGITSILFSTYEWLNTSSTFSTNG